jgi:hypothetical protein
MEATKEADMELYVGIDLHSGNSAVTVLDEQVHRCGKTAAMQ